MLDLKLFSVRAPFPSIAVLFFFLLQPGHQPSVTAHYALSSAANRGDRTQEHFQAYSQSLARYYESLSTALSKSAPDLFAQLRAAKPTEYGYQILPKISSNMSPEIRPLGRSIAYSWPWTERLIGEEWRNLAHAESELHRTQEPHAPQKRQVFERLALDYRRLRERQRNIEAHVQYNLFWQAAIVADRANYDLQTVLHNDVLERQRIRDGLDGLDRAFGRSPDSLRRINTTLGFALMSSDLKRREAFLTERINSMMSPISTPLFVSVEQRAREWVFRVPVYTDIEDEEFVASARQIIEATWQLSHGAHRFRIELDVSYITTDHLYADSKKIKAGERIDVRRHLRRFPSGAAILTTGAVTTHVQDYAIVLGPHAIAPRVLAHEFGHILGFRDRYIRGYKDLGENGLQVMEVIADRDDIMAAPATGVVLLRHFEMLLQQAGEISPIVPGDKKIQGEPKRAQAL